MKHRNPFHKLLTVLFFLMALAPLSKAQAQSNYPTEIIIGDGTETSCMFPFNACSSSQSYGLYSEYVYPESQMPSTCLIRSISFNVGVVDAMGYMADELYIYFGTTSENIHTSTTDWLDPDEMKLVYSKIQAPIIGWETGWGTSKFELDNAFYYTGGDLVIGIGVSYNLNTPSLLEISYTETGTGCASMWTTERLDPWGNIGGGHKADLDIGNLTNIRPNIKLGISIEANLISIPNNIDMGIRPSGYWSAPVEATLVNDGLAGNITSATIDNDFFQLNNLETPLAFNAFGAIPYSISSGTGEAGNQTGQLTITYDNNKTTTIPLNATAYTPQTPDVWELAREVTAFPYEEAITGEMAMYDNYQLPGNYQDGKDAVYKLDFDSDVLLTAKVTNGNNGKTALYREGFEEEGGPKEGNFYSGIDQDWATICSCDFENGNINTLNWENDPTYPWFITNIDSQEGKYCMKSGNSGIFSTSTISLTLDIPHTIIMSFWARISSQFCKGYFYIDDVVKIDGINGDGNWVYYSYEIGKGSHTFKWVYDQNDHFNYYQLDDCFYVDNIIFGDVHNSVLNSINEMTVPPGTYYLVASSTSDEFTVSMDVEIIPSPETAFSPSPCNNTNLYNENPNLLSWDFGEYTTEYQLLFGETNPPTNVIVDWTNQLGNSYAIETEDSKTYYWCVNERNSSGTTNGPIWMFSTFKGIQADANNIIYVTPTGAGVKNGSSWANAAVGIQDAIDVASAITDNKPVIWAAKGTYYTNGSYQEINGQQCCFLVHGGVNLFGSFNGDEQADYDLSLRDFENHASILDAEGKNYVVGTNDFGLDGFVIQHGKEGGIYDYTYSIEVYPFVRNCKILYSEGIGAYFRWGNTLTFENNEISYHSLDGFSCNAHIRLKNCKFTHNQRYGVSGFALICDRCELSNNGNGYTSLYGAMVGCLVANNDGFGASCNYILSSTIVNNGIGITGNTDVLCNSIIWGNEQQADVDWNSWYPSMMAYNAIQGGINGKNGIYPCMALAANASETGLLPGFEQPSSGIGSEFSNGIWTLKATSPCINAGIKDINDLPRYAESNMYFNNDMDFDFTGNQRVQQGRIDLGAIETSYVKPNFQHTIQPDANNIIYVKTDGQGNGSSWEEATSNLHQALEASVFYEPAATVWVAGGNYPVGDHPFQVKQHLRLYGGFAGNEPYNYDLTLRDLNDHATILDGGNTSRVVYQSNPLTTSEAAVIDGFTIHNGLAGNGAGAYLLKNTSLSHCIIENNTATGTNAKGGGIYTNEANIQSCFVRNNTSTQGGGIFALNSVIIQSLIGNNFAESGGGIWGQNTSIAQSNIVRNQGGGIYVNAENNHDITCLNNTIIWGNEGNNFQYLTYYAQSNTYFSHCAVLGLQNNENGNLPLSVDNDGLLGPHFVEPSSVAGNTNTLGNWQLQESSPCINAGSNTIAGILMPTYDIQQNYRIQHGNADMGVYESSYEAPCLEIDIREVCIRPGDSYSFYGTSLNEAGNYEHRWTEGECDSLVILHLHVADLIYVSEEGSGNMDGSSWDNALDGNTMQSNGYTKLANLLASAIPYSEFWITEGLYLPCGDQSAAKYFTLPEGVKIYGGFKGTESSLSDRDPENEPTLFSGEIQNDDVTDNNTECVLVTSETNGSWTAPVVLDEITISNGYASTHKGAALRITPNASVLINNCSIVNNNEGGIYNQGRLNVTNSDLSRNNSELFGEYYAHANHHIYYYNAGAICNMETGVLKIDQCTFDSNHSPHNGAICNDGMMQIDHSVFDNNTADIFGTIFSPGKIKVHNTTFNYNRSDHYIAVMIAWDSLEMINCNITNNRSNYYTSTHFPSGGAQNFPSKRTSGVESTGYCKIVNCNFINNDAGTCPGGALTIKGTGVVENCVFRENTGQRPWRDPETGGNIGAVVYLGNPDGGALYVEGTARVSDCEFSDNSGYRGQAIGLYGGSLFMERCKIVNSIAVSSIGYGAIAVQGGELTINNSLIANNSNVVLFQIGDVHPKLNNVTIANNSGGAAFWFNSVDNSGIIELNNSILSGYPSTLHSYEMGNEGTIVTHNTLMNQPGEGSANDPLFVNPTTHLGYDENVNPLDYDWHLQAGSPCINAGNVSLLTLDPLATDLDGELRVKNGLIDMGAYEYGTTFNFIHDGDWNVASNWNVNAVPSSTDEVYIKANCQLNVDATVASMAVEQGQSITLQPEKTLNVTGILSNVITSGLVIEDGAQLWNGSNNVYATAKRNISPYSSGSDGWNFIASPITNDIHPSVQNGIASTSPSNYDLYYYEEKAAFWRNYKNNNSHGGFDLSNGHGYLYANAANTTLLFEGPLKPSNASVVLDLDYHTDNESLAGWNLVGNPFPCNAIIDHSYYLMNEYGTAIDPSPVSSNTPIPPCTSVLVKAESAETTVTFNRATQQATQANNNGNLLIAVSTNSQRGNTVHDKAIVSFNQGDALSKYVFNNMETKLYIPQGNRDYAIAFSDKHGEMPLNFTTEKNGEFTIKVTPEDVTMTYLHLIDNLTGADVDLLATPNYTFTAKTSDYASRFRLVFSGIDNENESFAFISNGNIIVDGEGTLQIIDALGRIVRSEQLSTLSSHLSTHNYTPGVYVLRLINGDKVRTQKIVIK